MTPPEKHPCDVGDGELDHCWIEVQCDNGDGVWAMTSWYRECERCGETAPSEPQDYDDYYDRSEHEPH